MKGDEERDNAEDVSRMKGGKHAHKLHSDGHRNAGAVGISL